MGTNALRAAAACTGQITRHEHVPSESISRFAHGRRNHKLNKSRYVHHVGQSIKSASHAPKPATCDASRMSFRQSQTR